MMINVKKSPKTRLAAYTLVLPLAFLLLVVNNLGTVAERLYSLATAQTKEEISGFVFVKESQQPLQGVSIVVKGSGIGTVSDLSGHFTLAVNEKDSVCFSYVGYTTVQLPAQIFLSNNPMKVVMTRNVQFLESVVVTAYGKKRESAVASTTTPQKSPQMPETKAQEEEEKFVFQVVEKMPEFPGGEKEMMKFIVDNLVYPNIAAENGIEGRVICNFDVSEDGSIGSLEIAKGRDPSLDKEALRVIRKMPNWIPAEQRGKKVSVTYSLPVEFRLAVSKD